MHEARKMQEVSGVGGTGGEQPLSPEQTQHLQDDYQKSFDLFENALKQYSKPNVEYHKKQQLKKVMDEALDVMNKTAHSALQEGKLSQEKALENDYKAYMKDPTDANQQKLLADLKALKS